MRKRVAIAVSAVVAMGVSMLLLWQPKPKEGSVEWHVIEAKRADRDMHIGSIEEALKRGKDAGYTDESYPGLRLERHLDALIALGYWEERLFHLTNAVAGTVAKSINDSRVLSHDDMAGVFVISPGGSNLWVHARRVDMPKVADVIRKVDVP